MKSSSPLGRGGMPSVGVKPDAGVKPSFHGVPAALQAPIEPNLSVSPEEVLRKAGLIDAKEEGVAEAPQVEQVREAAQAQVIATPAPVNQGQQVVRLDVSLLTKSPFQPRRKIDSERLKELALSISSTGGLNNPITVRPLQGGRFEVIAGHRRWEAIQNILGEKQIDAIIRDLTDAQAQIHAALDNQDEELSDHEFGLAYRELLDSGVVRTQTELCVQMGVGLAVMHRRLAYSYLPEPVREMLDENPGLIGGTAAAGFARLTKDGHHDIVLEAIKKIAAGDVTQERGLAWAEYTVQRIADQQLTLASALEEAHSSAKLATSAPKPDPVLEPLSVGHRVVAKSMFKAKGKRLVLDFEDAQEGADLFEAFKEFLKQRKTAD